MAARLKFDDEVVIIAGKDKGSKGRILKILADDRVIVQGVNMIKRHQSPQKFRESGIIEREAPIHASNVMLVDPETSEPTRVRFEVQDGKKVRVAVKSGKVIG